MPNAHEIYHSLRSLDLLADLRGNAGILQSALLAKKLFDSRVTKIVVVENLFIDKTEKKAKKKDAKRFD